MDRNLRRLGDGTFDLAVVGGGIFGAAAALDAAQRGLKVALIERGDFCSQTSAHSFKVIHGGIRYLQHADLGRIRQSSNARRTLIRIAPHLARPKPFVIPTYGHGMKSKEVMRLGMAVYDTVTWDRSRGIADPGSRLPGAQFLSRAEVRDRYPSLEARGLTGAAVFHDGQMYNPPRLVLACVQSAARAGAVAANYVEATQFLKMRDRVIGVRARDAVTGAEIDVHAHVVLNAAGPYAEGLLESSFGKRLDPTTPWSRDTCFLVARPLIGGDAALALTTESRDPGAVLSRGARHLFLVPWRGHTLVGVWHKVFWDHPDSYRVTDGELETYIAEINAAYPGLGLSLDDVAMWSAGLVQFGENNSRETGDLNFAHRSRFVDHAKERGIDGLLTLIGVRYTTGPVEAAKAVDAVVAKLRRKAPASRLDTTPLFGGAIEDFEALLRQAASEAPAALDPTVVRALVHNHGTEYGRVFDVIRERAQRAARIGRSTVIEAEIVNAIREEMAMTLADIVFRRTDLATGHHPGADALLAAGRVMQSVCGWDPARLRAELEAVERHLASRRARPAAAAPSARAREAVPA